jgi:hypothetical protein
MLYPSIYGDSLLLEIEKGVDHAGATVYSVRFCVKSGHQREVEK